MSRKTSPSEPPLLVTSWNVGVRTLSQGYTLVPMDQPWCYRINRPGQRVVQNPDGLTDHYNLCLDESDTAFGCSCPAFAREGRKPCKHMLAAMVQIWQWAHESPLVPLVDFAPILDSLKITALYEAAHRPARDPLPVRPLLPASEELYPLAGLPTHSASGRALERRDPRQWRAGQQPWAKTNRPPKERVSQ